MIGDDYLQIEGLLASARDEAGFRAVLPALEESHWLDFKREMWVSGRLGNEEIAKDLSMFSIDGGFIVLGVQESDKAVYPFVIGNDPERIDSIAQKLSPALRIVTHPIALDSTIDTGVIVVQVPPIQTPCRTLRGIAYIRDDRICRQLRADEFDDMTNARSMRLADAFSGAVAEFRGRPRTASSGLVVTAVPLARFRGSPLQSALTEPDARNPGGFFARTLRQAGRTTADLRVSKNPLADVRSMEYVVPPLNHQFSPMLTAQGLAVDGTFNVEMRCEIRMDGSLVSIVGNMTESREVRTSSGLGTIETFDDGAAVCLVRETVAAARSISLEVGIFNPWIVTAYAEGLRGLRPLSMNVINHFPVPTAPKGYEYTSYDFTEQIVLTHTELEHPGECAAVLLASMIHQFGSGDRLKLFGILP